MFFPDIPLAVSELARVVKPGGRISASVWAEPKGNPWATIPMAAMQNEIDVPIPPPDAPGLFRCSAPDVVGSAFRAADLSDVTEVDVLGALEAANADEYWAYLTAVVAPVVSALAGTDPLVRERVRKVVVDQVKAYESRAKVSIPLLARCIKGVK